MQTADHYQAALRATLPPGRIWPESVASTFASLLVAIGEEFARLEASAYALLDEADPRTTTQMLTDWERTAGLPDPCHGLGVTLEARRNELVAKITSQGSLSRQFYINVAAQLGFVVSSIDEFDPANPGPGGLGFAGDDWYFVWRLNIEDDGGITYFLCTSGCDEPLASWGDEVIECVIDRIKPAHTRVLFAYV